MSQRSARPVPRTLVAILGLLSLAALAGCGSDDATDADASLSDAGVPADASPLVLDGGGNCDELAAACASDTGEFGTLFTSTNGRADGTLVAMVRPEDTSCALPNNDHAVLQLSILGNLQRLVVSLDGVAVHEVTAPLVGPPFEEGWHPDMALSYPTDLGVSSTDFTPVTLDEAVAFLCSALTVNAPVSVYAYCDGSYPSSAHQIHRNDHYPDGAIVVAPDSASPTWLLFRYADQQF